MATVENSLRRHRFSEERSHILTVQLEDYFHGVAFRRVVDKSRWSRFEARLEQNTLRVLDLLEETGSKATFFVLSTVAASYPKLLAEVLRRGHAIGSAGVTQTSFRHLSPQDFREEARRSKDSIEAATGRIVRGFRMADRRLSTRDLWAFEVLAQEGYVYDSSLSPSAFQFLGHAAHTSFHRDGRWGIRELPLPSLSLLGYRIPIAGGNYFRQFPESLSKIAVEHWMRLRSEPFIMYFRVWDLDRHQPRITGAPWLAQVRHYRNPSVMPELLTYFLQRYRFTSAEEYLDLPSEAAERVLEPPASIVQTPTAARVRVPVTVVIPCFNEELVLPYLANTLGGLRDLLEPSYDLTFLLVDDGSSDGTWQSLHRIFGADPRFRLILHPINRGVAAAILTGVKNASTEVVCSMDCDCTYDPHELAHMIPLLSEGVDLVTASPYHPEGAVVNVPAWRLGLSRAASLLYGAVLRLPLHTYTSCFRVYRRSAVEDLALREPGFLGVAELLGELALNGSRIVEHPAVLETRMLGRSKMRVLQTALGHLRLMTRFLLRRHNRAAAGKAERASKSQGSADILNI